MTAQNDLNVVEELENRLDHFFGDAGEFVDSMKMKNDPKAASIHELKSILLSIDWEITDEIMTRFVGLVGEMDRTYRDDRDLHLYLQILGSIGKYIKINRGKSHPDAMKVMTAVFSAMERVNLEEGLPAEEKEKVLAAQVQRFKRLKSQIALNRENRKAWERDVGPEEQLLSQRKQQYGKTSPEDRLPSYEGEEAKLPTQGNGAMPLHEAFVVALEEIKELIRSEFKALRAEVKSWK